MISDRFRAMGTNVDVWVDGRAELDGAKAFFEDVEAICSRFRPDSELCRVNDDPAGTVDVGETLTEILVVAEDLGRRTGGIFDIAVGGLVKAWGYDRTFEEVEDRADAPERLPEVGEWKIDGRTLVRSPGVVLDLGGVAKGWTADRLVTSGGASVVSAGGDIRSAHPQTSADVLDPWGEVVTRLFLGEGGLATSSVSKRRWTAGSREANHLIDPRTLAPAHTPVLSATVLADTCVEAEAAAKTVLLMGEDGLAWADDQDWIRSALVVWEDRSVYGTTGLKVAS